MFLDHLTHIARAASKSWRASAWLLERTFPEECNLRHRAPQPADDGMPHMPTDGVPNDGVPLAPPVSDAPHKPEAQAREESHATEESPLPDDSTGDDAVPTTPFADSGRATQQSPTNPSPPTTEMDLAPFETSELMKTAASLRYGSSPRVGASSGLDLPPDHPLFTFGEIPPQRNNDPVRRRIYEENLTGFQIDQAIEEQYEKERQSRAIAAQYATHGPTTRSPSSATGFEPDMTIEKDQRKERSFRNAAQLHTNYACDPADLYNMYPNNGSPGVPPPS
jgi:hypothetical protein